MLVLSSLTGFGAALAALFALLAARQVWLLCRLRPALFSPRSRLSARVLAAGYILLATGFAMNPERHALPNFLILAGIMISIAARVMATRTEGAACTRRSV